MTPVQIAQRTLAHSAKFPYVEMPSAPLDAAERAALAICYDLCDRRGIKREMEDVDDDTRRVIVAQMAAIIRLARQSESVPVQDLVSQIEARLAESISQGKGPLYRAMQAHWK